jgi:hypothetical protein
MTIGAQVAKAYPAAILTVGLRTEVFRGVDVPWASGGRGYRLGRHWRGWLRLRRLLLTEGTERLAGETGKRLGLVGAWAPWLDRFGWPLRCYSISAEPSVIQQEKQPEEFQDY